MSVARTAPQHCYSRHFAKGNVTFVAERGIYVNTRDDALSQAIEEMSRTPGSGVRMCHEQGKTAVYLSRDGKFIVTHPPDGPITRELLPPKEC